MWDELYQELKKYMQAGKRRLLHYGRKVEPATMVAVDGQESSPFHDFTLICQEDIFHPKSRRTPILLLSKGQEISTRDLPKLISHGVQPEQFRFKAEETSNTILFEETVKQAKASAAKPEKPWLDKDPTPISPTPSLDWRPSGKRRTQTVVILESNPKILKRLIDCLFVCGFDLNKIHPVGVSANLAWSLQRYTPDVLIGSANLLNDALNIETLTLLPERLIMTLEQSAGEDPVTETALANGSTAYLLYRPITRFNLRQLLMKFEFLETEKSDVTPPKPKRSVELSRKAVLKMG